LNIEKKSSFAYTKYMAAQVRVGLDIGYSSIKVVAVSHHQKPPKLVSLGHIAAPQPGIVSDADLDLEAVAVAIKNLIDEMKIPKTEIIVALPESRLFTRVIYDLPYLTDEELAHAIRYAAEEFVPMPIQDVNLYYQVIYRSEKKGPNSRTVVFVIAAPKTLIDKYLKVLQMADIKPLAIESELIAITRALVSSNPFSPTTLLIQMGALTTDYAVVSEDLILLTRSISTGGIALTRAIAQAFNFEFVQAEEYKKVYGLLEDQLEGKLYQSLKPIIDVLVTEAKRVIEGHEAQNRQRKVKRVVLSGGGAQLPGLVRYLTNILELEVQEADPWFSLQYDPKIKNKLISEGATYSVGAGLALRNT
jgi:type IV pilus assembly protein PilM